MTKKISLIILFTTLFFSGLVFAREASFSGNDYEINLHYNDTACPGDAIFIRMKFTQTKKSKVSKEQFAATTAKAELLLGEKRLEKSTFYTLDSHSSKNTHTMLTGIPLSSWWTEEDTYCIKVTYNLYGTTPLEFTLPFSITPKEFVSETLQLDAQNTSIKTNTSVERMQQIEKLNKILDTIDEKGVHQLSAFTAPTTATRRTSFFADRRVYAYNNGKSSTSLHYGIDYGIPEGSEVTACAGGKVVMAENRISTGWSIVIEHLPGLYSLYYHLSEMKVAEGDSVKAGDLIGLSGKTGLATGPHLHWEIRLNMVAVNPDFFTNDFAFEGNPR